MVLVGVGVVDRAGTSRNSKKWASDPEWAQNGGVGKIAPPKFFGFGVSCPWAQNGGCKLYPPK